MKDEAMSPNQLLHSTQLRPTEHEKLVACLFKSFGWLQLSACDFTPLAMILLVIDYHINFWRKVYYPCVPFFRRYVGQWLWWVVSRFRWRCKEGP